MRLKKTTSSILLAINIVFSGGGIMAESMDKDVRALVDKLIVKEFNVTISEASILAVTKVDWPSSALGCSQSGQYYMPVITPGYRLSVLVNDIKHTIHTSMNNAIICDPKDIKPAASAQMKLNNIKIRAIQLSREKLLATDGTNKKLVRLLMIERQIFDSLAGSSVTHFSNSKEIYRIKLQHKNSTYFYYSDGEIAIEIKPETD